MGSDAKGGDILTAKVGYPLKISPEKFDWKKVVRTENNGIYNCFGANFLWL